MGAYLNREMVSRDRDVGRHLSIGPPLQYPSLLIRVRLGRLQPQVPLQTLHEVRSRMILINQCHR